MPSRKSPAGPAPTLRALTVEAGLAGDTPKLTLLGFGNRLWHDDGAGAILAERLGARNGPLAINGGMVPENHLEQVVASQPDTILLADAADMGLAPGEYRVLPAAEFETGGVSTHAGSPRMLAAYLAERTGAEVYLLAIQPGDVSGGEGLSREVEMAVQDLVEVLCSCGSGFSREQKSAV